MSAIFVAGTDTDVGKTHFCALLLDFLLREGIRAGYQKWVATGPDFPPADLVHCLRVAAQPLLREEVPLQVPCHFALPASPHLAAEEEGREVDPALLKSSYEEQLRRYALLVVEGVGGLMVPLRRDLLLVDFLAELRIPTLLVARSGLGTLNHTLLSLEALRVRAVPVLGVVCSDGGPGEQELVVRDNLRTIAELGRTAVLGRLPYLPEAGEGREAFFPLGRAVLAEFAKGGWFPS